MSQELRSLGSSFLDNSQILGRATRLPRDSAGRELLKDQIDRCITELKQSDSNLDKIAFLQTRKRLIDNYGLSLERIDNLQTIFLHYCTHIFKTGKHMTFERLEYEKSHLTMDRFFVFLKDFKLTSALVEGELREIFDMSDLILLFKKVSINCKDVNFEQFVSCLQRIALLYYDSKTSYPARRQQQQIGRKERKENYLKSIERKQAASRRKISRTEVAKRFISKIAANIIPPIQNRQNGQATAAEVQPQDNPNQNDELVKEMMNDMDIQAPHQELKQEMAKAAEKSQYIQESIELKPQFMNTEVDSSLFTLTAEEKIEYFYQLIDVDNSDSFKKKMRQLNLPIFQVKSRRVVSQYLKPQVTDHSLLCKRSKLMDESQQQGQRLTQLRSVFEERKERDKGNSPQIIKEEYETRRQARLKNEKQLITRKEIPPKKKLIELNDLQTDLSSLSKIPMQNINFRNNPSKMYQVGREVDPYLQDYFSVKRTYKSQKSIVATIEEADKNSQILLEKIRKRAEEVQTRERKAEAKFAVLPGVAAEHQIRKNRLVEKMLRMHRQ